MDATQLLKFPLFAGLSHEQAEALSSMLRPVNLQPHQALFWVGDPGEDFYVIQHGKISVTYPDHSGREMTLATLGPGDFLGEISLLDGGPRTATARANNEATLYRLGRGDFLKFISEHPSVAIQMMTVLGKRQRDTVDRLRGIRNINEVAQLQTTRWQHIADGIATAAASKGFLITHAVGFTLWIVMNLLVGGLAPDPFPFQFLCFWASVEAIFLSLFILVSQSVQASKDRVRTEVEYQVALKMQVEIMQLHHKIDQLLPPSDPEGEGDEVVRASSIRRASSSER